MAMIILPIIAGLVSTLTISVNAETSADSGNTNYSAITWNPTSSNEAYPRGFSDKGSPTISYVGGVFGKEANDYSANIIAPSSPSSGIQYNSYDGAPGHQMNAGDTFELSYDIAFSDESAFSGWNQYYFRVRFGGKDLATTDGHAHGYGVNTVGSNPKFFSADIATFTLEAEKWYNYKVLFTLQADKTTLLAEYYIDDVLYKELVLQKSGGGEISGFSMADFSVDFTDKSQSAKSASVYVDNITLKNYALSDSSTPGAIKGLNQDISAAVNNEAKSFDFSSCPYITARKFLEVTKGAVLLDNSGNEVNDHTPMRYLTLYASSDRETAYTYLNSVLASYPETVFDMETNNASTNLPNDSTWTVNGTPDLTNDKGVYGKSENDTALAIKGSEVRYFPQVAFSDTTGFEVLFDIAVSDVSASANPLYYMQTLANGGGGSNKIGPDAYGIKITSGGDLYFFGEKIFKIQAAEWYNIRFSMNQIGDTTLDVAVEIDGVVYLHKTFEIAVDSAYDKFTGFRIYNPNSSGTLYLDNITIRHLNPSEMLETPSCSGETIAAALNTTAKTFDFSTNTKITAAEFMAVTENMILLDNYGNAVSDDTPMRHLNLHAVEYGYPGAKYTYLNVPAQYQRHYYDMETVADGTFPDVIWVLNSGDMSGITYSSVIGSDGKAMAISSAAPQVIYKAYQAFGETGEKFELSFDFSIESQVTGTYKKYIQILYNDVYGSNSLGTADGIHIMTGGALYMFGKNTGITVTPKQWYSLKFEMMLTADNTKLAVNAYVDGSMVVSGEFTLSTSANVSVFRGFKIYNNESTFYIDNVETSHCYKSETTGAIIEELEKITNAIDLVTLPDPLTNASSLTLPTVPSGYTIEINSSSDESIIDKAGNITRSGTTEKVYLTFKVTNTAISESRITDELLVPVYKTYTAPSVSEEEIADAKAEYEKLKYGVFVHYVPSSVYADGDKWGATDSNGNLLDIDALANSFDAEQFAKDINDSGAEYVVFTAWHAMTYPLFPSMTNERWRDNRWETEGSYSKTYSDRDVISDLLDALEPYGISLHLYIHPSEGKDFVDEEQTLTGWNDSDDGYAVWNAYTNELIYELGERYGDRIDGLWIDAFFQNISDEETFKLYATANNPKMILNMNVGLEDKYHIENPMPEHTGADYRAWEFNHQSSLEAIPLTKNQTAIVIGSQWFTDYKQDTVISLNTPEEIFRYIVAQGSISESGGFLASFGCYPNRTEDNLDDIWQKGIKDLLSNVNIYLEAFDGTVIGTLPGAAYPTAEGATINSLTFVSTESADGKYVYIHILNSSTNTLTLPAPSEGYTFSESSKLIYSDGSEAFVTLTRSENGEYILALPEGMSFDEVDTVLELKCIDSEPPATEEVSSFVPKFSVSLYSDFRCNIYIPVMDNIVNILIDGNEINLASLEIKEIDNENYYHYEKAISSINAAENIRLTVSLRLTSGKIATGNFNMGILKYAELVLSKSPETYEKNLMKAMLAYISAAYNYANRANAASVAEQIAAIIGEDYSASPDTESLNKTPSAPGIVSASMDIGTVPVFIFYPETDAGGTPVYAPENYIFKSGNKILETIIEEDDTGKTYIKVYTYAYGLCGEITYNIEGTEFFGSYNIGAYYAAVKSNEGLKDDTALISLIERLWKYSESANDYRIAIISK